MDNLSAIISPSGESVADIALAWRHLDNLRYIHSRMPEMLTTPDSEDFTLLEKLFWEFDADPNTPTEEYLKDPLSDCSDILRFLLPIYSATEIASIGEHLLSILSADDDDVDDGGHDDGSKKDECESLCEAG
jgi:hypothetical protein